MGMPAPGFYHVMTLEPSNRLETLEQLGWSIRYKGYFSNRPTNLPRKLIMKE